MRGIQVEAKSGLGVSAAAAAHHQPDDDNECVAVAHANDAAAKSIGPSLYVVSLSLKIHVGVCIEMIRKKKTIGRRTTTKKKQNNSRSSPSALFRRDFDGGGGYKMAILDNKYEEQ